MRTGKRVLAGVAAGALGLALIPFVATTSASAASGAATVSAVRSPATAGTRPDVPSSFVLFDKATYSSLLSGAPAAATFTLLNAPDASAKVFIDDSVGTAAASNNFVQLGALDDTTLIAAQVSGVSGDDSFVRIGVDTAGTYSGQIANGEDTVTFSFATTGAPTTIAVTPATQTVPVGGSGEVAVTLLDADGNVTQPLNVDSVNIAVTGAGATLAADSLSAADLAIGTADVALTAVASGTSTVTAAGAGTIGALTGSATITGSGNISSTVVTALAVADPANANNLTPIPAATAQVPAGTTSVTVGVTDTDGTAGNTLRFGLNNASGVGTINGSTDDTQYVDVVTNASKEASVTVTLSNGAQAAGNSFGMTQVTAANVAVAAKLTVTQTTPAVQVDSITPTPSGEAVAAVGATTNVVVQVDDSFGNPAANYVVAAQRINANGSAVGPTTLSSATTGADGSAAVTVSPLDSTTNGQYEIYQFVATSTETGVATTATLTLQVNYTTSGDVTSMTVTPSTGNAFTNAAPTLTEVPAVTVASGGDDLTGLVQTTQSTGDFDVTTGVPDPGNEASLATFRVQTSPSSAYTVTVPEGLKVSNMAPTATTLYSAGSTTAVVSADDSVYVWGTKTGLHDVTVTAGGISLTGQVLVWNRYEDAFNIGITPADQTLATGAVGTVEFAATDMFGNAVEDPTAGAGVAIGGGSIAGEALFAGFMPTVVINATATSPVQTTTVIAGNSPGSAAVGAALTGTVVTGAAYEAPEGIDPPVLTAAASITVQTGPTAQAILILDGYRDGQRIETFGGSSGFDMGAILKPWIRFPGQTGFSMGTANILVDDEGDWNWGRKTGKRTAVQIRSEDGLVRSNTVIIEER